jgi:hypothetical protein
MAIVNFVSSQPIKHDFQTTIKHWQLRDLLHSPQKKLLYSVENHYIKCYDTGKKRSSTLSALRFDPTALNASFGYIVAGGQYNQLYVLDTLTKRESNISIGGSINNSITIYKHERETNMLVSNNDFTIKAFSLPSVVHIRDIPFSARMLSFFLIIFSLEISKM